MTADPSLQRLTATVGGAGLRLGRAALAVMLSVTWLAACTARSGAQGASSAPSCTAALCEDEELVRAAVEAAIDGTALCTGAPVRLLTTLHAAPYTAFADGVLGREPRYGLPSSPPTLRLEDIGILSTRRFRIPLQVVDSTQVRADGAGARGCLVVASPPTMRETGEMRVIVAVSDPRSGSAMQVFVFLRRVDSRWVISRREVGYRS